MFEHEYIPAGWQVFSIDSIVRLNLYIFSAFHRFVDSLEKNWYVNSRATIHTGQINSNPKMQQWTQQRPYCRPSHLEVSCRYKTSEFIWIQENFLACSFFLWRQFLVDRCFLIVNFYVCNLCKCDGSVASCGCNACLCSVVLPSCVTLRLSCALWFNLTTKAPLVLLRPYPTRHKV